MIYISLILITLFGIWSYLLVKNKLKKIDDLVYSKIKISELKTIFFKVITFFASTKYFVLISFILIIIFKFKALYILIPLIISAILVSIFKHLFKRIRPNINRLVKEKGYSFPSGHTTNSTCFYGILIYFLITNNPSFAYIIVISLIILVLLIAISRIYLGVHFFSDVIGGILLGTTQIFIYVYFMSNVLRLV